MGVVTSVGIRNICGVPEKAIESHRKLSEEFRKCYMLSSTNSCGVPHNLQIFTSVLCKI